MDGSKLKVAISIVILVAGLAATMVAVGRTATAENSSGIVIDFGGYDIVYTEVDDGLDSLEALEQACAYRGLDLQVDDGIVVSIDGRENGPDGSWSLYAVGNGSTEWSRPVGPVTVSNYSAVCYGFCQEGSEPAPAVDGTGVCFYGYDAPERIVSLSSSCTETLCSIGAMDLIVGTDLYSNYPKEVAARQESGDIAIIGGFTNPSFEMVMKQDPDLVVCVDSQNAHVQMAEKFRNAGIDVLVLDGGESVEAVFDNIYQAGTVIGNREGAEEQISLLRGQMQTVIDTVDSYDFTWDKRVMVALSAVKSPWTSGSNTYVNDVISMVHIDNIYSDEDGWVQVNAETIAKLDPEFIIVVSTDYEPTQSAYDAMVASMSSEWKGTTAYRNGEIYLFCGDAADCASRPAPRVAQLTELVALAVQGDAFGGSPLPKFVGDDYTEFLQITGDH